jgi:hypothetical protein
MINPSFFDWKYLLVISKGKLSSSKTTAYEQVSSTLSEVIECHGAEKATGSGVNSKSMRFR